jgi:DNA modification methylase
LTPDVTVLHGDCLDRLRELADASVSAIVTDPPYGLSDLKPSVVTAAITAWTAGDRRHVADSRGFMGLKWDAFVPPPAVWDECLRVLKPGGHLLCFAGTRTVDLMALSVRLAGFEIRDTITWLYGCLTADAEVLTEYGWRPGIEVRRGERVAQWDHETGEISLAPVAETFHAPWDGPMRVLRNSDTDQLLTPNHRVYHRPRQRQQIDGVRRQWYRSDWEVAEASELSTWNPVQLPIAGEHDGPGVGGVDYAALLGWVWTEGGFDPSGTGVRIYQSSVNAAKVDDIQALLDRLGVHKRYDRTRTWRGQEYVETTWFISGELAERVRADLPGKRPTYDLLWRMNLAEKRALRDAALAGDGHPAAKGVWQFYQRHEDDLTWFATLLALVGQAGKVGMRPDRDNGTVYVRDRSTTELQGRHLRDSSEKYTGEVWCVRVPTGAFVARRNGRVFITGNSGFPKSLDVSKAIDKDRDDRNAVIAVTGWLAQQRDRAGLTNRDIDAAFGTNGMAGHWTSVKSQPKVPSWERWLELRELIGFGDKMDAEVWRLNGRKGTPGHERLDRIVTSFERERDTYSNVVDVVHAGAPITDGARQWSGWGTALKPASEPIIVARKPLSGTVAATVLEHGTGALNIDTCRVGSDERLVRPAILRTDNEVLGKGLGAGTQTEPGGRWPANVVLTHAEACGEECAQGCPIAELDQQSGITTSPTSTGRGAGGQHGAYSPIAAQGNVWAPGDTGGASRFFPTFHYQAKAPTSERPNVNGVTHPTVKPLSLLRWMVKLCTPPGGTVLDPFAGSGTTIEAAILEGFDVIGIEREAEYLPLIRQRIDRAQQPVREPEPPGLFDLETA